MKPKTPPSKVDRLILEEASEWFVDFRVGDIDQHSRERFDEWLRRSPEHIRAYMEIAKTYVELPLGSLAGKIDVDSLIAYAHSGENVVSFNDPRAAQPNTPDAMSAAANLRESQPRRVVRTQHLRRRILAAASFVLVVVAAAAVWWRTERFPSYTTDIGERRSITLPDGSTVDLNARSKLRIEFTEDERRIVLLDGQALFQVAKDKNRPFTVASGEATVRAVGTQFDVNRRPNGTTVTVLEGRVAVYSTSRQEASPTGSAESQSAASAPNATSPRTSAQTQIAGHATPLPAGPSSALPTNSPGLTDPSGSPAIFLSAGEQVTVTSAEVVPVPARADIAATTAWMQRRLIFDGSRLSDVVLEFNRYNKRQLVIDGAVLSDFHVSGVYSSTDPASLIRFLREQPGMKITEDDNVIRIAPR
jgi:transmembrane sensor